MSQIYAKAKTPMNLSALRLSVDPNGFCRSDAIDVASRIRARQSKTGADPGNRPTMESVMQKTDRRHPYCSLGQAHVNREHAVGGMMA